MECTNRQRAYITLSTVRSTASITTKCSAQIPTTLLIEAPSFCLGLLLEHTT